MQRTHSSNNKDESVTVLGVQLNNANLVQSSTLETQLLMVLELLADHSAQFEVTKKAISGLERNVTGLQSSVKQTKEELAKTNEEVARVDRDIRQAETRLQASIDTVKKDVDRVSSLTTQLSDRITALADDVKPRLQKVEEDFQNFQADLDQKFSELYQIVETNKQDADAKIEGLDARQKATRAGLMELERRFNEADIDGLRLAVSELDARVYGIAQRVDEGEKRTTALEECTQDLNGQIKDVRNNLNHQIQVVLPKTYATKEQFEELSRMMKEVVTKKELEERLDDLHALINTFVFGELGKQRQEIYHKITVVQERLTSEIEEVARGEEIQMCVDRVQQFVHDIEDIGVAVSQHNDAIENAASQLASMGNEFEQQVDDLREGCRELNVQVEGIMGGMNSEITKVVESMEESFVGKAVDRAVSKATEAATGIAKDLISKIPAAASGGGEVAKKSGGKADGKKGGREHKVHDKQDKQTRPASAQSASSARSLAAEAVEDFDLSALAETASKADSDVEETHDKAPAGSKTGEGIPARPKTSEGISRAPSTFSRPASGASSRPRTSSVSAATIELPRVSPETSTEHGDANGGGGRDHGDLARVGREDDVDSQAVARAAAAAGKQQADKVKGQLLSALDGVQNALKVCVPGAYEMPLCCLLNLALRCARQPGQKL